MQRVRSIDPEDLGQVSELYQTCFNAPPWNDGWTTEAAYERMSELTEHPRSLALLGQNDELVVAMVLGFNERWTHGYQFHLKEICVHPNYQAQGCGKALMSELHRTLRENGIDQVYLETRTGAPSESFFANLGYSPLELTSMIRKI